MKTVTEVSARAYKRLPAGFDPMTILVIIQILVAAIKLYRACKELSPEELAQRYPILARLKLWWNARRALRQYGLSLDMADAVTDVVFEEFKQINREEVQALLGEVSD